MLTKATQEPSGKWLIENLDQTASAESPYAIDEADTKWPRIPLRNMGPAHSDSSRGGLMRFASALSFAEQR